MLTNANNRIRIRLLVAVDGKRRQNFGNHCHKFSNKESCNMASEIAIIKVPAPIRQRNELAQVDLINKLATASALAARRGKTMTRLLNENKALRDWYESELPDDVIRLHTRPAFATTADYLQWLSESGAVPAPGQHSPN
jgi:LysB family phage lysis regulatory protein